MKMNLNKDHKNQILTDKFAMTMSLVCLLFCLFAPSFLILTSGFLSLTIENELIHNLILVIAIPISIFALCIGYKNHKKIISVYLGSLGIFLLVAAVTFGEIILGDFGEKGFTFAGSALVIFSHYKNYQTCKKLKYCCHHE
mgnify:CR=1 FL=1|tara:strand:+ start:797 stop:1219 length:423 start_codon:yes stop_codon:yes gene_type:complete